MTYTECNCCGKYATSVRLVVAMGIETYACAACRHAEEEEEDDMTEDHVLMRVIGFAAGGDCPIAGQWLASFDHEAEDGLGAGVFTDDPDKAMRFDTISAALEFWKRQSTTKPLRDTDGRANRPLTCTTVTFDCLSKPDHGAAVLVEAPVPGEPHGNAI